MKVKELIEKLQAIEDKELDVMSEDINDSTHVWQFWAVDVETVKDDEEFPEDYDMPKGYQFVRLTSY